MKQHHDKSDNHLVIDMQSCIKKRKEGPSNIRRKQRGSLERDPFEVERADEKG